MKKITEHYWLGHIPSIQVCLNMHSMWENQLTLKTTSSEKGKIHKFHHTNRCREEFWTKTRINKNGKMLIKWECEEHSSW